MTLAKTKKNAFLLLGIVFISILIFTNNGQKYHIGVLFTSFAIAAFSLYKMFRVNGKPYSLNKIFYIFTFFFLGIAPALQFKNDISFWGANNLWVQDYLITNAIIIFAIIIYDLSYSYFSSKPSKTIKQFKSLRKRAPINKQIAKWILMGVSLFSFILFFYSQGFNLVALLVRGGIEYESSFEASGPFNLILNIFIRPIPVVSLIVYRLYYEKFNLWEVFLIIIVLLSNAPTGMPRFQAAALYIPIAILYFKPLSKNVNFSLVLSGGLLIIFPLLNIFRHFAYFQNISVWRNNMFLTGNFDSYHNFVLVVKNGVITYGEQLLGVLLFFVPRSIWVGKPIGSGHFIADKLGLMFPNISMSYFAEGYINFGFVGILFFIVILAFLNSYLDKRYWRSGRMQLTKVCYLFLLGMEFFVLRGDLMSSFAYTIGIVCSSILVYLMITKKVKVG